MSGPPRLLVVAADTTFLVQVKDDLEAEGYTVVIATDPKEALTRTRARVPDLIVIDVDAPRVDGWRLCKRLRAEPPLALVPIIFLSTDTSADNRAKGFSLGADDVLAKPVDAERLAFRVAKALAGRYRLQADIRQQGAAEAGMGPPGPALVPVPARRTPAFSGTLEQLGLSTVLNILDTEKKTGRLDVANGEDGAGGTIEVRLGRIVRASVDADGGGKNREAIYGMLGWSRGIFRFYAAEVGGDDEVGSSTTHLLIDGARAQDEDDGRDGGA